MDIDMIVKGIFQGLHTGKLCGQAQLNLRIVHG